MPTTVKTRTFSSVQDNRSRLSNSNYARLWSSSVGTSWTTIRIFCRISIEDAGANLTSTPRFAFGISSGTANIFQDTTTTHWLGLLWNIATWTRDAGPPVIYRAQQVDPNGIMPAIKVGASTSTGFMIGPGNYFCF